MLTFSVPALLAASAIMTVLTGCSAAQNGQESAPVEPEIRPDITSMSDAIDQSEDKQSPVRLEATLALGDIAMKEESASPQVIELLLEHLQPGGDELVQSAAEISVRKIGKKMLPAIEETLASKSIMDQASACNAIRAIGTDVIEVLPRLKEMLQSEETTTQRAALYALQGFGDQSFEVLDEVTSCLTSHDFNVQCMACRVLEMYGEEALPAEKYLVEILETGNPSSRGWAAIVLGAIGPTDGNDVVPMLMARLSESRAHVEKQRILLGLAHLGREAKRAVPIVTEYMNTQQHHVKPHAAYTLYRIAGDEPTLVKALSESLADRNQKQDALEIIRLLGDEALPMKAELVKQLGAEDEDVREQAVLAIGRIGPEAADTLADVEKLLEDDDALVREAASETIRAITPEEPANESSASESE